MKIFCICYENMRRNVGGVRQIIGLCEEFQRLGNQIQLCAPLIEKYPEPTNIEIKYIPVINAPVLRFLSYLILSPFYVTFFIIKFKPDVVIFFEIYLDCFTLLICRLFRIHLAFFVNAIAQEEFKKARLFMIPLVEFIQKIYCRSAGKVFTISEIIRQYLHEKHQIPLSKIEIVKNGVNIEVFKPVQKEMARKNLNLKQDNYYIGFVGGLFSWQGLDYLIDAAPFILREMTNIIFMIVGYGETYNVLLNQVSKIGLKKNFIFTGAVSFQQVPLYINTFDVCVVFSKSVRTYRDPIKLYEYLSCGKPVVASNVKGYGDFVESIGVGISVNASNPEEVAHAVIKLLKDENLRTEMGKRARTVVLKEHTWFHRAMQLDKCFRTLGNVGKHNA